MTITSALVRRTAMAVLFMMVFVILLAAPAGTSAQGTEMETPTGICDRTTQVRDAILDALSDKDIERTCSAVTDDDLAEVQSLFLGNRFSFFSDSPQITELKAGDFQGLSNLHWLTLDDHGLSILPDGIFDDLSELTRLDLRQK